MPTLFALKMTLSECWLCKTLIPTRIGFYANNQPFNLILIGTILCVFAFKYIHQVGNNMFHLRCNDNSKASTPGRAAITFK